MSGHEGLGQTDQDSSVLDTTMFEALFSDGRLGENYDRALATFKAYGANLSQPVLVAILHARDQGLVAPVLDQLDRYNADTLQYQHPQLRGLTTHILSGVNPTDVFFEGVFKGTLGLTPLSPEQA